MEMNKEKMDQEFSQFRAHFKEDAFDIARKSYYLEKKSGIATLYLDQFQEKANKLSSPNMIRLFELFNEVENDKSIQAMVIISKKPTIFIAGADISEIKGMTEGVGAVDALIKLQSVFTYLSEMRVITIAAIHGACMGGGTELTLACDYRIATEAPETKIALPEVMLGVLPGWGGTQRMPRLIGLENSLDLILSGRAIDAKKAKKMGLIDKVAPTKERLESMAVEWAIELGKKGKKRKVHTPSSMIASIPGGKMIIFDQAKKKLMEKTKGHYPAPLKALEVIRQTFGGSIEKGLKVEAQGFAELVKTPESANLIRLYYLNEKVKKATGVTGKIPTKEVKRAGVLGAGVMGGGIAQLFAAKGIPVRMKDLQWDAIAKGYAAAHKVFSKLVEKRKMRKHDLDNAMARIEGTTTYAGFSHLDLVVEAVVENIDVKKKVFQELEKNIGDSAIIASNTSSLSVTEMATVFKKPERFLGMHFFNPVDKMPLVEIIRGEKTNDEAVATLFSLSKKLGKTPIVVKDAPGFVVNRILAPYLNEAIYLVAEGNSVKHIDKIMEKFGMPMGPLTLLDEIGLDVGAKVSKILFKAFGERMQPHASMEKVSNEPGRLGKKSGKGIYLYDKGKKGAVDSQIYQILGAKTGANLKEDEIVKRLIYIMINEASRVWEEGLVQDVSDIDVGMIFGTGFAPFRGGLLRYADSVGAEHLVHDLELLAKNRGNRFRPSQFLQQLAVSQKKFYND